MHLQTDKDYMIFRKDYNEKTYYKIGLSHKKVDGSYENGYMTCKFRDCVILENKTKIKIKNGWLDFYNTKELKNNKEYTITHPFLFINEFEIVGESKQEVSAKEVFDNQIDEFSQEVVITDDMLPW